MSKKILIIILFSIAILSFVHLKFRRNNLEKGEVCFEENCFIVELAKSPKDKARGLMFRKKLRPSQGMLFIFEEEGYYPFWMKNMEFPLDIIWINNDKEVVFIREDVSPCSGDYCEKINSYKQASYVLELVAGKVKETNIENGDKVIFNLISVENF